ncbi:MAG: YdcH family protein [Rhodospirillales bacterium]
MTEVDRLEALKDKHDALEQVLTKLETIKQPDELEIQTVKKQKLHLKDEIAQLSR